MRRSNAKWNWVLFSLLLTFLPACTQEPNKLLPLTSTAVLLAYGDSLTYGTGADQANSYPAVLARLIGRKVINAGVPGEISADALKRLAPTLDLHQPALLLLTHGGNDLLRHLDLADLENNLSAMVEMAQAQGIDVLLVGVPRFKLLFLQPADLYDRVAAKYGLVYLRDTLPELEGDTAMKSDAIHLNAAGYRAWADAVYLLLQEAGALPRFTG